VRTLYFYKGNQKGRADESLFGHFDEVRNRIAQWKTLAHQDCELTDAIAEKVAELMSLRLRQMDASHVACAIALGADFFLTTDKKVLILIPDKNDEPCKFNRYMTHHVQGFHMFPLTPATTYTAYNKSHFHPALAYHDCRVA